ELLRGAPPLGPGAPPGERLAAFYAAMAGLLERHAHLVLGAETGRARFATGAYGFWRAHVLALLRAGGAPEPEALADPLLAPLAPDVFTHQREQGLSTEEIASAPTHLARPVLPDRAPPAPPHPARPPPPPLPAAGPSAPGPGTGGERTAGMPVTSGVRAPRTR